MKLDVPLKTLGPVNYQALKFAVEDAPAEAWLEEEIRQKAFDVHKATQSIILLFTTGWPEINISQHKGWRKYSPLALPIMRDIIARHYSPKGTVIRAMFARLLAGRKIDEHFDDHPTFTLAHRIHVPLITSEAVEFNISGVNHHLKEGIAYEVSNLDYHYVANPTDKDRVHFIFDYVEDEQ